jgi:amino acid transporter
MVLEFGVASALVAVGFSGYFTSLLRDFGLFVPTQLATPFIDSIASAHGLVFTAGHGINLVAALAVLAIATLLSFGIVLSAAVNSVMVVVKVTVLVAFVAVGIWWIEPHNWVPFVPANQGGFTYGWPGVVRAASVIFFAYVGFETVSTAGLESRDPRRDLPLGILGALLICTVIYLSVAAVLTGLVPFRNLAVPDPLAVAVNGMRMPWFALMIKLGAALGLLSVTLTTLYGQTPAGSLLANQSALAHAATGHVDRRQSRRPGGGVVADQHPQRHSQSRHGAGFQHRGLERHVAALDATRSAPALPCAARRHPHRRRLDRRRAGAGDRVLHSHGAAAHH